MALMGDNSFEALALPHVEAVYRLARRLTSHEHEAEDLVQEVFLRAWQAFGEFEMREFGIRPWLFKITNNAFLNRRAKERNAPRATDASQLEQNFELGRTDGAVLPALDYDHLDDEVKAAVNGLAPEFRTVLLLWATMELSYREISDILSVPIGTVMSRLHRARAQLSQALGRFAREHRLIAPEGSE